MIHTLVPLPVRAVLWDGSDDALAGVLELWPTATASGGYLTLPGVPAPVGTGAWVVRVPGASAALVLTPEELHTSWIATPEDL